nr:dUTP diphosphatase [Clostridioides sp.]
MELKVKRLNQEAKLPSYAHIGDAGMDICSIEDTTIKSGETKLIKTGIAIELPKWFEAQIRPRSGLALKHSITVLNSPGTIDECYRGEIGVILINHGNEDFKVEKHMRIAQMVIKPIYSVDILEVDNLTESKRGESGFGSTGLR